MHEFCFRDLDAIVDEVHAIFGAWADEDAFAPTLDAMGVEVMKLAVHEWIANLVQHAAFGRRPPEIRLAVGVVEGADPPLVRCEIEDNSDGFDFSDQVGRQHEALAAPEPGERGRGLLMLIACSEDLRYESLGEGRQRLAFHVPRAPGQADMAPLFASTDFL